MCGATIGKGSNSIHRRIGDRDLGTDMDVLSLFGRQECLHFPKVSLELELGRVQLGAEPIDGSLRHLSRLGLTRYLACWKARYCFRNVFGYAR